jgi:hypothetical protein
MKTLRMVGVAVILTVVLTAMGVLLVAASEGEGSFRPGTGPSVMVTP